MRHNAKILMIALVAAFSLPAFSQTENTEELLNLAKQYQTGRYREVNPEKAYQIYSDLATQKVPQALVELGNMNLRGEGTEQNFAQAFELFQEAAELDYAPALCRLAFLYQKGVNTPQDFSKAFELYNLAAEKGDADGCYGAGYLTYKGFGVQQSYAKALTYFQKGADKNDARCEYMLGCHALTGYDNNQDIEKGKKHLERAMAHGHRWVEDVIKYNMVDSLTRHNKLSPNRWTDVKNGRITQPKRTVANNAGTEQLVGEWKGKVYTYDWSGKKIESEETVKLTIEADNNLLMLHWFTNDALQVICYMEEAGDVRIASRAHPYNPSSNPRWYVSQSRYDIAIKKGKEVLYIDFLPYNIAAREPGMPQMVVLERTGKK